jgi:hypothetical protein
MGREHWGGLSKDWSILKWISEKRYESEDYIKLAKSTTLMNFWVPEQEKISEQLNYYQTLNTLHHEVYYSRCLVAKRFTLFVVPVISAVGTNKIQFGAGM